MASSIGGTVAELQQRMSWKEFRLWQAYAVKHGGLPIARMNYLLAMLCTTLNNAHGGKATLSDFMPELPPHQPKELSSADEFMKEMGY